MRERMRSIPNGRRLLPFGTLFLIQEIKKIQEKGFDLLNLQSLPGWSRTGTCRDQEGKQKCPIMAAAARDIDWIYSCMQEDLGYGADDGLYHSPSALMVPKGLDRNHGPRRLCLRRSMQREPFHFPTSRIHGILKDPVNSGEQLHTGTRSCIFLSLLWWGCHTPPGAADQWGPGLGWEQV